MMHVKLGNRVYSVKFYRHSDKSVYCQLRSGVPGQKHDEMEEEYTGVAYCHKGDKFNKLVGQRIALLRALNKMDAERTLRSKLMKTHASVVDKEVHSPSISEALSSLA